MRNSVLKLVGLLVYGLAMVVASFADPTGNGLKVNPNGTLDPITVQGDLTVTGNNTVGGSQTITGNSSVGGNQTVNGNTAVTGSVTSASSTTTNLTVTGTANLPAIVYARYFRSPASDGSFMGLSGKIEDDFSPINGSGEWVVPVAGLYLLTNQVNTSDGGSRAYATTLLNGVAVASTYTAPRDGYAEGTAAVITVRCVVGDKLKFQAGNSGGSGGQTVTIVRLGN